MEIVDQTDSSIDTDPFAGEFAFRCKLAVTAAALHQEPEADDLHQVNYGNLTLLEVLNASTHSLEDSDLDSETQRFLVTLDAKMEMLLRWTGQLLRQDLKLAPARDVEINAHGIKIYNMDLNQAKIGHLFKLNVFLSEHYPEPLQIFARLKQFERLNSGKAYCFKIERLDENVIDALEKYIFKRHRQQISSMKKNTQADVDNL